MPPLSSTVTRAMMTNIIVEGPSDRELIRWSLAVLDPDHQESPLVHQALVEDFGRVKQMEGFLRAVLERGVAERALVAVFDGDDAGQKHGRLCSSTSVRKMSGFSLVSISFRTKCQIARQT